MSRIVCACLAMVLACGAVGAATPDEQYRFAEELARSGETPFAVLEYRRFVFLYPQDPRVPDARFAIARAYLQATGDVAGARRELDALAQQHPNTPAAARAGQLLALIEANREDDYAPARLFFGAIGARDRGDHAAALQGLDQLVARYPRAAVVPEAVFLRAQALEALNRLDDAIAAYAELPARAPQSPLVPRALLGQAVATEARDGAKPHVAVLYRQIIARYPNTPEANAAQERLAALGRQLDDIPRVFARKGVQPFKVVRQGYLDKRDRYDLHIEVAKTLTEDQVKATLEDALVAHAGDRKGREHEVRVEAYFSGGRTRIGKAIWAANRRPEYDVDLKDTRKDDAWRGILDDVFR